MPDGGPSIFDIVAAGLAVLALGELVAARIFSGQDTKQARLIASLLLWEGVAMLACAAVIYTRQNFDVATIISLIALWMAGAGVGLLRAGVFDAPRE
jgi:hypothetical protein